MEVPMLDTPDSDIRRSPSRRPEFGGLRRYNRRALGSRVVVQDADGWEFPFEGVDVSPTGLFVRSKFLFDAGDEHTLIFDVDGQQAFRLRAKVARVETGDAPGGRSGMGYEFVDIDEEAWQKLCAALAGM